MGLESMKCEDWWKGWEMFGPEKKREPERTWELSASIKNDGGS